MESMRGSRWLRRFQPLNVRRQMRSQVGCSASAVWQRALQSRQLCVKLGKSASRPPRCESRRCAVYHHFLADARAIISSVSWSPVPVRGDSVIAFAPHPSSLYVHSPTGAPSELPRCGASKSNTSLSA